MKKLLLLLAVLSLNGCALYDAYFMAKYDTSEHVMVSKIRTMAELGVDECKNQLKSEVTFNDLYYSSVELRNFTQYIPRNDDTLKLATNIVELSKQGKDSYAKDTKPSEMFCKLKLQQISRAAEIAQKVIGKKPR
jgi:hypothetical protein